jgi:hypothetical protein
VGSSAAATARDDRAKVHFGTSRCSRSNTCRGPNQRSAARPSPGWRVVEPVGRDADLVAAGANAVASLADVGRFAGLQVDRRGLELHAQRRTDTRRDVRDRRVVAVEDRLPVDRRLDLVALVLGSAGTVRQ